MPNKVHLFWVLTALSLVIGISGCHSGDRTKQLSTLTPTNAPIANNNTNTSNVPEPEAVEERPVVVTTNNIVCGLTRKIVANTVDLKCLNASAVPTKEYQPTPEDLKAIEQAKLILYSNYNYLPSLSKLIQTSSNPAWKVAVDSKVSEPQASQTIQDGISMAEAIAQTLSQLEPNQAALYTANKQRLNNELTQINTWNQSETTHLPNSQQQLISARELSAYLNPRAWPNINEQARLAKVPVIMYHDILPTKQVFFDVTPEEFEQHLQMFKEQGVTPISLDQLVMHLRTGLSLPEKPILLTFDDGYGGHYEYVYPLLKKYGYPGVFSVYTSNVGKNTGRSHVTWEQLREMVADPLVTIASHSVTHPLDMRVLSEGQIQVEVTESKRELEAQLGIPMRYFTYPSGKYDERVTNWVRQAGYEAALTMNDLDDRFAGQSKDLLAIDRIGQGNLKFAIAQARGGSQQSGFQELEPRQHHSKRVKLRSSSPNYKDTKRDQKENQ